MNTLRFSSLDDLHHIEQRHPTLWDDAVTTNGEFADTQIVPCAELLSEYLDALASQDAFECSTSYPAWPDREDSGPTIRVDDPPLDDDESAELVNLAESVEALEGIEELLLAADWRGVSKAAIALLAFATESGIHERAAKALDVARHELASRRTVIWTPSR